MQFRLHFDNNNHNVKEIKKKKKIESQLYSISILISVKLHS